MPTNRKSLKWKLGATLLSMVILPTFTLGLLTYLTFKSAAVSQTEAELTSIAKDWQIITSTYMQQEERVLKRELALIESKLEALSVQAQGILQEEYTEAADMDDQVFFESIGRVSIGRSGYIFVLDDTSLTYLFSKDRSLDGTVFMGAMNADGKDITGEIMDAVKGLSYGETYVANFYRLEPGFENPREQMVAFSYLGSAHAIIGALSYYSDFQSTDLRWILQDELRSMMAARTIGEHGYIWALDGDGNYIVSKGKLRDGENVRDLRHKDGDPTMGELIAQVKQLPPGETMTAQYSWKNIGEASPMKKMAVLTTVPEWDWTIGVSAYEKDYLANLHRITIYITLVCIISILVGSLVSYILSLYIIRPIEKLREAATHIRDGNYGQEIKAATHDEVGELAESLEIMRQQLKTRSQKLEDTISSLKQTTGELAEKNLTTQKLNDFMVNRELKMIELKKEIERLKKGVSK